MDSPAPTLHSPACLFRIRRVKVERKLNVFVSHCSPSQGASCSTLEAIKLLQFTLQPGAAIAAPRRGPTGLYIVLLSLSLPESERERGSWIPQAHADTWQLQLLLLAGHTDNLYLASFPSVQHGVDARQTRLVGSAV